MSQAIRFDPSSLTDAPAEPPGGPPRILIFGGSQGAHAINVAMVAAAPQLAAHPGGLAVTHQTGERDVELVRDGYRRAGLEARVEPFLFAMEREMKAADLVICRAGATTLAELTAAGKPSLLVPLPTAADDHQRKNAEVLAAAGAAELARAVGDDGGDAGASHHRRSRPTRRAGTRWPARRDGSPSQTPRSAIVDRALAASGASSVVLGRTRRIHFVGIGGIGMSGIAELLANLGYEVSGSDAKRSTVDRPAGAAGRPRRGRTRRRARRPRRRRRGVVGDQGGQPGDREAVRRQIPVIPRAEMLAELMRLRYGIAIAGAHGKTSTTSMVALVLERAGLDPTAVIGGRLSAFGSNARLGRGDYMVVEADESDRSFLKLSPSIAVITNIDHEHMESYGSWADLQQAFVEFANKVPFYGAVIACADDEPVRSVLPRITRRLITYGLATADGQASASVTAHGMTLEAFGSRCRRPLLDAGGSDGGDALRTCDALGELRLQVPGRHNLLNALAAVAVGLEVGIPFDDHRRRAGGIPGRRAAVPAARRRRRRHGGGRLRPSPDRDRRRHRRGARRHRPARRRRVPAASLHPDQPAAARVRLGPERRRRGRADRHLRRR